MTPIERKARELLIAAHKAHPNYTPRNADGIAGIELNAYIVERLEAGDVTNRAALNAVIAALNEPRPDLTRPTESDKAAMDLLMYGTSITRDGKRIDPATVSLTPPAGGLPELPEPAFELNYRNGAYYVTEPNIGHTRCYTTAQLHAYALEAIAASRVGDGWVSATERLPEGWEHVEVWPDPRDDTYSFYAHSDGGTNGVKAGNWYYNDRHGDDYVINVTHWRQRESGPLPAAPQVALNRGGEEGK